jgi:DNA invertase Pin-like site-specific DNA recombinase
MKTAALYVRVSKKTQEPETQLHALREYARKREYTQLVEYLDVAPSGANRQRPTRVFC